ncbi:serine/threonine-protein kinase [Streptomyces hokutonensis]|uniref:serine/threonine-protein kinase n=1 Tax=Streptomyces hokutonensis TaxID=1306990 RepID=UPI003403A7A6
MLELDGSGAEPLEDGDPRRIGPVPLVGWLGAGGTGRVYLGVHEGRYVAVKQVRPAVVAEDKTFLHRFGRELDNLAKLPAWATAPLLVSDRTAQPPWFATAYVPGLTLREAVELHGAPLPADVLWLLLREAASGLAVVHALDMVHRDLKPSNVMLSIYGATVIDFGVARAVEQSRLTRTDMVVGTCAYMSPEQASRRRRLSGAVDVFALGSVLAYATCGRPPFGDESERGVLHRIVHEEPDLGPVREVAPELAEVVAACLDKDPEARPSAAELVELADRHGPFTPSLWPQAISEQLSQRAAFAATVPVVDALPEPVPALPSAGPELESSSPRPERRERRWRTRIFLAVVPVVVVAIGTVLAIQLLSNTSASQDEGTGGAARPDAGATGTRNDSGGTSTKAPVSMGGYYQLQSVSSGQCVVMSDHGGPVLGECSDSPASAWAYKYRSDGYYYQLVNERTGQCLSVSADDVVSGDCDQSSKQSWFGTLNETMPNLYSGQCLGEFFGRLGTITCVGGETSQRWIIQ